MRQPLIAPKRLRALSRTLYARRCRAKARELSARGLHEAALLERFSAESAERGARRVLAGFAPERF